MFSFLLQGKGRSLQGKIVTLAAASCKKNFTRFSPDGFCHLFTGFFDRFARFSACCIDRGSISPAASEKRHHLRKHRLADRRCRCMVQIDSVHHKSVSPVSIHLFVMRNKQCQKFVLNREKLLPISLTTKKYILNIMVSRSRISSAPPITATRFPAPAATRSLDLRIQRKRRRSQRRTRAYLHRR